MLSCIITHIRITQHIYPMFEGFHEKLKKKNGNGIVCSEELCNLGNFRKHCLTIIISFISGAVQILSWNYSRLFEFWLGSFIFFGWHHEYDTYGETVFK